MALARQIDNKLSEKDYLSGEKTSDVKFEYIDGDVFAMAGATRKHNRISGNFFRETDNQLKTNASPCTTFSSDMKVKISNSSKYFFYPDVMVSCENNDNEDEHFITSPKIIVEVLSKSTRKNDTTIKMVSYFTIPSLEEYVLIEQDICEIQVFKKSEDWRSSFYYLGDDICFSSINVTVSVEDIYYQIKNEEMSEFLAQKII
jgi:Uma2 family endonuclease